MVIMTKPQRDGLILSLDWRGFFPFVFDEKLHSIPTRLIGAQMGRWRRCRCPNERFRYGE
jgi:hypothetical protein